MWQRQGGRSGSVAAAAVWRRQPGGIGVVVSAWRCGGSGGQWQRGIVSVIAAEADPCGRNGVAAAVWQRRQAAGAAGQGRPWVINQRVARAFVRVRGPGALTFSAISEVGVGGRRVKIGHGF